MTELIYERWLNAKDVSKEEASLPWEYLAISVPVDIRILRGEDVGEYLMLRMQRRHFFSMLKRLQEHAKELEDTNGNS